MDTEKLLEHLDSVGPQLLSAYESLQRLVSTNSIYPIYKKEAKSSEKDLRAAIDAFLEMKDELSPADDLTSTSSENESPGTLSARESINIQKIWERLNIVETTIHSVVENIHMINTAHAIYPIHERDGLECEAALARTMNALIALRETLELYSVSELAKAEEQLLRKEVQCTSSAELQVHWQCPLCHIDLTTTLAIGKDETERRFIAKPHYSIPVEAQECPATIFYVTYRHPDINVVASIPEE